MKSFTAHIKRASLALVALSSVSLYQSAFAAPTDTTAGTDISNTATVNYTVGSVAQTAINSNTTTFEVDKKVDLTVAKVGTGVTTVPGAANVGLPFTVTNTGNDTDSFTLTAANLAGDQFDTAGFAVYLDAGTLGVYDAGVDTLVAAPVAIARDITINVLIVSTVPGTPVNTDTADMTLTATTTSTATVGAETATVVDVVFADAGNDGTEVDTNTYTISTATLAVVKSAVVLADPVNCPTGVGSCGANQPKAIPGATVRYTITVTNSGAAAATAVTLTDNIPTNTTYVASSMTLNTVAQTDATDGLDNSNTVGSPTVTSISVNAGAVAASGGTATVTFDVTVN